METGETIDWRAEQDRFMALAYTRCERAARRAFKKWHSRVRADAIAECVAKVWATWTYNLQKGKDPVALLGPNIHFAILFVRYDRKTAGRARSFDVMDFRAGLRRQQLDGQGIASPSDRSDPSNGWIDWHVKALTTEPAELAAALEAAGMTAEEYFAA
jgi:hypothetical protein